jgi:hypothetical protein
MKKLEKKDYKYKGNASCKVKSYVEKCKTKIKFNDSKIMIEFLKILLILKSYWLYR